MLLSTTVVTVSVLPAPLAALQAQRRAHVGRIVDR
jgi:hypothetical protein